MSANVFSSFVQNERLDISLQNRTSMKNNKCFVSFSLPYMKLTFLLVYLK